MAQSEDSNLRGLEFFWMHSTNEISRDWKKWTEQFHLIIIAKERELIHAAIPEQPGEIKDATQRQNREE